MEIWIGKGTAARLPISLQLHITTQRISIRISERGNILARTGFHIGFSRSGSVADLLVRRGLRTELPNDRDFEIHGNGFDDGRIRFQEHDGWPFTASV